MKKVLFLSYYFPPRNRISSYRVGGFCQHLIKFDWEPTVICEDWPVGAPDYDESLLDGIENLDVHRITSYGPKGIFRFLVRNVYPWIMPEKTPYNWWRLARKKALELCSKEQIDAIVASHDPLATLQIALELSSKFKIPWIADLRDSWNVQTLSSPRKQRIIAHYEKEFCNRANAVVTVSDEIAQVMKKKISKDIRVVSNGFDKIEKTPFMNIKPNIFTILYAGSYAKNQKDPRLFFRALNHCVSEGKIPRDNIELCFLGPSIESFYPDHLKELGSVVVRFKKRIIRKKALAYMENSSLLWVISHPHEKGVLTGKIFDYLAAGRPIIAAPCDNGEIKKLLEQTQSGFSFSKEEDIVEKLCELFALWKKDKEFSVNFNQSEINKHSRVEKTREFSKILNEVVN